MTTLIVTRTEMPSRRSRTVTARQGASLTQKCAALITVWIRAGSRW
jgi:hypothetical protein